MTIGCSLPYKLFTNPAEDEACMALLAGGGGQINHLLAGIQQAGAESVEFRSVGIHAEPSRLREAYLTCRAAGLAVTIHGQIPRDSQSKTAFFAPYQKLLKETGDGKLMITLHALAEPAGTAQMLDDIAAQAIANDYPVLLALENSRKKIPGDAADSCEGVCGILDLAENKDIGVCWDFGHYFFNQAHFTAEPARLPPAEFIAHVCHTHIHSVYNEITHYPLNIGELPLLPYCKALTGVGYSGLFNLELGFSRFYKELEPYRHLIDSIKILKEVV